MTDLTGCAAPDQSAPLPAGVDLQKETVITGVVTNPDGETVGGAYVRLLDSSGEFTAEVVSSPEGVFRFFAAPGFAAAAPVFAPSAMSVPYCADQPVYAVPAASTESMIHRLIRSLKERPAEPLQ